MSRVSNGMSRLRVAALLLAAAAPMLLATGCWRGAKPVAPGATSPPSPTGSTERPDAALTAPFPPAAEGSAGAGAPAPGTGADGSSTTPPAGAQAPPGVADRQEEPTAAPGGAPPAVEGESAPAAPAAEAKGGDAKSAPAPVRNGAPAGPGARAGHVTLARLPEHLSFGTDGPPWARGREELVYRVEFLGITMGYARFVFNGKVLMDGREVYHLSVRAWTSNVLAIIYPVNDTIDYYMDIKTLEPLRQEYTSGNRKKDDVTTYDQETGRIVYRYKESGEIRKQVDAVPNVYDPVTLAYFFRSREPGAGEKGRNVYAGRKVWEISASPLGVEKIVTDRGEVETVVIRPVIRRDGKVEDKGDLRMWMTRDERKIPVRVYAKFKKIRTWTLVGELMPERKGG